VTLVACAGPQQEAKPDDGAATPSGPAAPAKKTVSGDVSFELPPTDIKANLYEPDALSRPGMPLIDPKRPTTADKLRAAIQSAKDPVLKQAQAAILVTMLYRQSKEDKSQEKAKWGEARQLLRDIAQQVGDQAVDEITLRLLGSYEILLEDYPAAEKAWQTLIDHDPKSKELPYNRAYLAYAQLKQFKNAEALASVGTDKPDAAQPELAYVMAWAKYRAGDFPGAWDAIAAAAKGWGNAPRREELEQNVLQLAGRANITEEQASPVLIGLGHDKALLMYPGKKADAKEVKDRDKLLGYDLLAKLGVSGYSLAGRWADAVAALGKAYDYGADAVPPDDRVVIRYSQSDYTVRLDTPDVAVGFAKQALDAVDACGPKCSDKDNANTVQGVYQMGRLFHILYATANDKRYYQPAHDLYALTIKRLPQAQQVQANQDSTKLELTLKNLKPGTGTHDKGAIGALLARHTPEVQACFEYALERNPKLSGSLTVSLESDNTGVIKGVTTQPPAGPADMAMVAGCTINVAKTWKLPQRGMAGTTRIKTSFTFSSKGHVAGAAQ
jgi:tetratricopeptide (TPR) repeat protein